MSSTTTRLEHWRRVVSGLEGRGKRVGTSVYLHVSALTDNERELVSWACSVASVEQGGLSVVRFDVSDQQIALLDYPRFFEDGFPCLHASHLVDIGEATSAARMFAAPSSRPVLHRKELLLAADHARRDELASLTAEADRHGLLADTAIIGHTLAWEEELRAKGLRVEGHRLIPTSAATNVPAPVVERHRTAMSRTSLSTPMQALWRHGFLDGRMSVFDYGCGRGDDIATLETRGIDVGGWDPHFRPHAERKPAAVVNLGFVLNVIEDLDERREALRKAFELSEHVLSVSALIGGRTAYERYRLFNDGVLTSRGTFQKYFTQGELGQYIALTLGREPIAVAPGVYFVFRSDEAEQVFLERRLRSSTPDAPPRPVREPRAAPTPRERKVATPKLSRLELQPELVESFWQTVVTLGRLPEAGEFSEEPQLRELVGTPARVLSQLVRARGSADLEAARIRRRTDVTVYLALNLFERRRSFGALPAGIRADIREHWGSYGSAVEHARAALFAVGNAKTIAEACEDSAARGLGYLAAGDHFQFDAEATNELPIPLRVYIGCATQLYGDVQDADLVKIHIASGKLSLMLYDDFWGRPVPDLIERIKIDLRKQQVDYFQYDGERFPPQPLYQKSRYLRTTSSGYAEQLALDRALTALGCFDFEGFGPSRTEFERTLGERGLRLEGWELRTDRPPAPPS